jgi:hypothetical protein
MRLVRPALDILTDGMNKAKDALLKTRLSLAETHERKSTVSINDETSREFLVETGISDLANNSRYTHECLETLHRNLVRNGTINANSPLLKDQDLVDKVFEILTITNDDLGGTDVSQIQTSARALVEDLAQHATSGGVFTRSEDFGYLRSILKAPDQVSRKVAVMNFLADTSAKQGYWSGNGFFDNLEKRLATLESGFRGSIGEKFRRIIEHEVENFLSDIHENIEGDVAKVLWEEHPQEMRLLQDRLAEVVKNNTTRRYRSNASLAEVEEIIRSGNDPARLKTAIEQHAHTMESRAERIVQLNHRTDRVKRQAKDAKKAYEAGTPIFLDQSLTTQRQKISYINSLISSREKGSINKKKELAQFIHSEIEGSSAPLFLTRTGGLTPVSINDASTTDIENYLIEKLGSADNHTIQRLSQKTSEILGDSGVLVEEIEQRNLTMVDDQLSKIDHERTLIETELAHDCAVIAEAFDGLEGLRTVYISRYWKGDGEGNAVLAQALGIDSLEQLEGVIDFEKLNTNNLTGFAKTVAEILSETISDYRSDISQAKREVVILNRQLASEVIPFERAVAKFLDKRDGLKSLLEELTAHNPFAQGLLNQLKRDEERQARGASPENNDRKIRFLRTRALAKVLNWEIKYDLGEGNPPLSNAQTIIQNFGLYDIHSGTPIFEREVHDIVNNFLGNEASLDRLIEASFHIRERIQTTSKRLEACRGIFDENGEARKSWIESKKLEIARSLQSEVLSIHKSTFNNMQLGENEAHEIKGAIDELYENQVTFNMSDTENMSDIITSLLNSLKEFLSQFLSPVSQNRNAA